MKQYHGDYIVSLLAFLVSFHLAGIDEDVMLTVAVIFSLTGVIKSFRDI